MVSKEDVEELRELGNGAQKLVPASDGSVWRVMWINGRVRVDKYDADGKIPLSARRVGGSAIPFPANE